MTNLSTEETLFFIDTGKTGQDAPRSSQKSAWTDDADKDFSANLNKNSKLKSLKKDENERSLPGDEFSERLRERHELLNDRPKWACVNESQSPSVVDEILCSPFNLGAPSRHLLPDVIELQRLQNANYQESSKEPIILCQYHPLANIVLVASKNSTIRFFTIDDKENPLLHKATFKGLSPSIIKFSRDGNQVFAVGNSRFIYIYDIQTDLFEVVNNIPDDQSKTWKDINVCPSGDILAVHGDNGHIILISSISRKWLSTLKMNGSVRTSCFSSDGKYLSSAGSDKTVYLWDLQSRKCLKRFFDNSGSDITSLSISPDMNYIAVGSALGVTNIYNLPTLIQDASQSPKPWKTLLNFTTTITLSVWHPSSELLALVTDGANNGIRLVHFPSGRVYSNWPSSKLPVGLVKAVSFKNDGSELLVGSSDGKVRRFSLNHYRI